MLRKKKLLTYSKSEYDQSEPYIGPRPFRRNGQDQLRFFGRDAESDEIVALIISNRNILIYAQSGAGKTSILNARVIPSLEHYGFEVLPVTRVRATSEASQSSPENSANYISLQAKNSYIYNALQSLYAEIDSEINPKDLLDLPLFEFLDKYYPTSKDENGKSRPQVLIFDQLEELFCFYPDNWIEQRKGFFQQVADVLDNNPFLRIVFVIREEFLAQLDLFRSILPEKLRAHFRLERLRKDEATLAIKGPINNEMESLSEDERKIIEADIDGLVKELTGIHIEDLPQGTPRSSEGEFVEPIQLQVVCRRWWHERETSKSLGNKKTSPEGWRNVDRALEDFYEDAILTATEQTGVSEDKIRIWCQDNLITSFGTRSVVHKGQKTTGGIDNDVVDWLERKYLIRIEQRSQASWYELTHDRLIRPITTSNQRWKTENDCKRN